MVTRSAQDEEMRSFRQAHYWGAGSSAEADAHLQLARKALQDIRAESRRDDILKRIDLKPIVQ
jgi:hypothetical protein